MKKIFILNFLLLLFSTSTILAQPILYGVSLTGGESIGTITKFESGSNSLTAAYTFPSGPKYPQRGDLIQATDGKLYGVSREGGSFGFGTIFSFDKATNTLTRLYNFNNSDGIYPYGGLMQSSNGKLYGMTEHGGSFGYGTLYSFDLNTNTLNKYIDFNLNNGGYPQGNLVQSTNGILYGMTTKGGSNNLGTIFSFDPVTNIHTIQLEFNSTNGAVPHGGMILASNGKLYGLTAEGGSNGNGILFSFDPTTNTQIKLLDFNMGNGAYPYGNLVQASNGKLYGMTTTDATINGAGTIFSFDPTSNIPTSLFSFNITNGTPARGNLVQAPNGKLYGMASNGGSGAFGYGTIFTFDLANNSQTKIIDFNNTNGASPLGSLVLANDGKLYGMTSAGGNSAMGTILSVDPNTNTHNKLLDLSLLDGAYPNGSLIQGNDSKLYGLAPQGGTNGSGIIYSFDPATNSKTKLYDFDYPNGGGPYGSLSKASNGKFYGVTMSGGLYDRGTIFSFDPVTLIKTKCHDFTGVDGASPFGSLIQATNGKLYGMTGSGGKYDSNGDVGIYGTIYSFDPVTNTHTKLFDLTSTSGSSPKGSLMQASNGKLYGMTSQNGNFIYGTIFSFDLANNNLTVLFEFNSNNGGNPSGNLIEGPDSKLYGVTTSGGTSNFGTIFSFDPSTNSHNKFHDFNKTDGATPSGTLVLASDGKFYGYTHEGGIKGIGTIFSVDPANNTFNKLQDYDGVNGANPHIGALVEFNPEITYYRDQDGDGYGDETQTIKNISQPDDYVKLPGDCNDNNAAINPGAIEICDGIDNNCDGQIDEGCQGNDLPVVSICNNVFVTEGNSGIRISKITVSLNKPSAVPVTVQFKTIDNSALARLDYSAKDGTAMFPANTLTQTIYIPIKGDLLNEINETFQVSLFSPINATIGNGVCTINILDDDKEPVLRVDDVIATENSQVAKVLVSLNTPSGKLVNVQFKTFDKTANAPADYYAVANGNHSFKPGETRKYVHITIRKDNVSETNESFELKLINSDNATLNGPGAKCTGTITIANSEVTPINCSPANNEFAIEKTGLAVSATPNPATSQFTISISSNGESEIHIKVVDFLGRVIEHVKAGGKTQQIHLGRNWSTGTYFLQVFQGKEYKTLQLIKL